MMDKKVEVPAVQARILDAAIACVERWGIQRVTLNDIADEAGVARSTVYSYYSNRDEVIRAGLLQSAYVFGEELLNHIRPINAPRDRLIEAVAYSLEVLPSEPYLALISDSTLSEILNAEALTDPESTDIGLALFQVIMQRENRCDDETREIVEFAFRFLLSLLTMKSPVERKKDELRGFIARRMLPSIGLTVPSKYKLVKSQK
jgi:AcrR family transcriptional regulator